MKVTTRGTPVTLTRPDGQRLLLSSGSVHGIPADFEAVARASLLLRVVDESDQPTHHESGEGQPAGAADETPPARQRKEKK